MSGRLLLVLVVLCTVTVHTRGDAVDDFNGLVDRYWSWRLSEAPEFALVNNIRNFSRQVENFSISVLDERNMKVTAYRNELLTINRALLNQTTQVAYDVLLDTLNAYLDGYKWKDYGPMNIVNFLEGIWTDTSYFIPASLKTKDEFSDYIEQIKLWGAQVDDMIARMNVSIAKQTTNHKVTMDRVLPQLDKFIANSTTESEMYEPFKDKLDNTTISANDKVTLRRNGKAAVDILRQQYQKLKTYIEQVYMPKTRPQYGVSSFNNGQEYYKACLKWHLGIDITPQEIHQKGKDEVKRISAEMVKAKNRLGFNGTLKEFFTSISTDSRFFIQSPEETLARFTSIINDRVNPKLSRYFSNIPDRKLEVRPLPYNGPAQYNSGSPNGDRPGVFYANVRSPESNPTYSMVALTLHETNPGHNLQNIMAAASKGVPVYMTMTDYTKYFSIPFHFPFYTAYTEGWALYAESLGEKEELDVYKDDYELIGRYGSEIFRACRLVVDSGLHAFNWTRKQAIDYVLDHTPKALSSVQTEIDRYITWPGQATAYKIGELKIKELRHLAQNALGDKFDIREFHGVILDSGSVPLQVLERRVQEWIEQEQDSFEKIMSDFWEWRMEQSPEWASTLNVNKYNDRLNSYKYEKFEEDKVAVEGFNNRLSRVVREKLTRDKKLSYDILQNIFDVFLTGYKWRDYQSLNPINFLEGWFIGFDLFVTSQTFKTQGDFVNYARRIELAPTQLEEMMELSRIAIQKNHVNHNASVSRIPEQIDSMVMGKVEDSQLFSPYNKSASKVFDSDHDRNELKNRLTTAITAFLNKLKDVKTFIQKEYMPHTRPSFGLGTTENGKENYEACLYFHTSVKISPEEVHNKGLEEVARIERLIRDKMENIGYPRDYSIQEMYQNLTNDPQFLIQDPQEQLARFKSIIFDRIAPKIPQYLSKPPNLPLEVRASGSDGVGGEYWTGTADGSRPGIFYANVHKPSYNPTFTMVALSLHEAIPGHHLAESYQILADAPDFRKYFEWLSYGVPYFFPFYNAFAEGWALYSEFLGEEMGIYENDYEMLGRYSEEMLRAVRLVVDTGIHSKNWSRQQAINYMMKYTSQTAEGAAIEIDRYATWPGQACGYKIGELKIKELRKKATQQLGRLFKLADFHHAILKNGAMPLEVLERVVDDWIADVKSANKPVNKPARPCDNDVSSAVAFLQSPLIVLLCSTLFFIFQFPQDEE